MSEIDPHQLGEQPSMPVIDVRTPGEFAAGRPPGAVNVPLEVVQAEPERIVAHLDGAVALLCATGTRAEQARQALADAGCGDPKVIVGGMRGWQAAGGDVVAQLRVWSMERQVRLAAGGLVVIGTLASLAWPPAVALSGVVGAGLVVAAATDMCGMAMLLAKLPWNRPAGATDPDAAMRQLAPGPA